MPRIARIVGIDYPHHIIQRGNNRSAVFFNNKDKEKYLELLRKYSSECACKINAYCLMKNHIHILAIPIHEYSLAKTFQKLSLRYTQYINKKYNRTGRLWECRFYSALVDKEVYLWSVCRYIERNPVRAKIVDKPVEYEWSSARVHCEESKNGFIDPIWQNEYERKEYLKFLNMTDKEEEIVKIRSSTYRGCPIGSGGFINYVENKFGITINTKPRGRPRKLNK